MRLKTSNFSKSYFSYVFRRSLPYTLIMAAVLLALNVCVFSLSVKYDPDICINLMDISIPTLIFMYVFPVILGCWHFRFLFSRNGADFYGSMPPTRAAVFNTNFICGLTSILIIIGVNTLYFTCIFPFTVTEGVLISPVIYLYYFINWFISYAVTFSVIALAATVSGTIPAQLILSYVIGFIPGFTVTAFQLFISENLNIRTVNTEITLFSADSLIRILFAPYYAVQQIFFLIDGSSSYTGCFYDYQTFIYFVVNVIILLVFWVLAVRLFRCRKFEIADTPYANDRLYDSVKILSIFPFLFCLFKFLADGMDFSFFLLFAVIITVFYVVLDLFLRKGLSKVLHSAVVYLVAVVFAGAVLFLAALNVTITDSRTVYSKNADISAVTVYLLPSGMDTVNSSASAPYNKSRIGVTLTDKELISEFIDFDPEIYKGEYSSAFVRLKVNGKNVMGRYRVSDSFMTRLYELINGDSELLKSLNLSQKRKSSLASASVSSRTYSSYGYYSGSTSFNIPEEKLPELLTLTETIGSYRNPEGKNYDGDYNSSFVTVDDEAYSEPESKEELFNTSITLCINSFINGVYYTENISTDGELFRIAADIINQASSSAMKKALPENYQNKEYYFTLPSCRTFENTLGYNIQILSLISDMCPEELYAVASAPQPVTEPDDTLVLRVSEGLKDYSFLVSYERQIVPIIEKYYASCLDYAESFDENYDSVNSIVISVLTDGELYIYTSPSYYSGNSLKGLFSDLSELCTANPYLYTAEGQLLDNLTGQDILCLTVKDENKNTFCLFGLMEDSLWNRFAAEDALNDGELDRILDVFSSEYKLLRIDGIDISEPADISYFVKAIAATYLYNNYNGKYEQQCIAYLSDDKQLEYYVPLTKAMQTRLKKLAELNTEVR